MPHRTAAPRPLAADRRGMASLEFAFISPLMLVLAVGAIELGNAIRVQAKLNVAAGQLAEMIAAQTAVSEGAPEGPGGTLGDLCTAASYNLLPYNLATLSGYIESTTVVQNWGGLSTAQDWASDKSCPASHPIGSFSETITLTNIADQPRSLFTLDGTPKAAGGTLVKGYSAISLQLTYVYRNVLPFFLHPSITFTAVATARPRSGTAVGCTYPAGGGTAACPGVY